MKLLTVALAGALLLTSTFAFAQTGSANGSGASLPENGTATTGEGYGVRVEPTQHRTTGMSQQAPRRLPDREARTVTQMARPL
jgi:hypothetical protein